MQPEPLSSVENISIDEYDWMSALKIWLRLGRVSNLPTVWANVFTGIALATADGTKPSVIAIIFAALAMTLAYLAGMFLNDVFDTEFDKKHRNDRPIANGEVQQKTVAVVASVLIIWCVSAMIFAAHSTDQSVIQALFSTLALIGCIVLYNAWHKNNPLSPIIMGACRALVYVTCSLLVSNALSIPVVTAAALLWLYVIGLTYTAKQEHLNKVKNVWPLIVLFVPVGYAGYLTWHNPLAVVPFTILLASVVCAIYLAYKRRPGDVPMAVVMLIAAMALLDSVLLFAHGFPALASAAFVCWFLTAMLQSWVLGT